MSKTPHILAGGEPVIGQFYMVPCARHEDTRKPMPVLGRAHSDPELRLAARHYHYDLRFFTDEDIYELVGTVESPPSSRFSLTDAAMIRVLTVAIHPTNVEAEVKCRRLLCRRPMPGFPVLDRAGSPSPVATTLEPIYAPRRVDLAKPVCSHKRFPLSGLPQDADGCVVCPLHGLRWNLTTGEMVPRMKPIDEP